MRDLIIKICGITNSDDARAAADFGADLIGLIFVPESPRFVTEAAAKNIIRGLEGRCRTVAVYKDADMAVIADKKKEIGFDMAQLHGDEPAAAARTLRESMQAPTVKALTVRNAQEAASVTAYDGAVDYLLFDRCKQNAGTDWLDLMIAELPILSMSTPFLLAGGLKAQNVSAAVKALGGLAHFRGVDVASGVESNPGLKDHKKMLAFINNAREAAHGLSR